MAEEEDLFSKGKRVFSELLAIVLFLHEHIITT
jgi:hypothetical protein